MVADVSSVSGLAIIDVTDGVAEGHEESIVNEQVSDVNYQESLGDSETARHTVCAAVAELSSRH